MKIQVTGLFFLMFIGCFSTYAAIPYNQYWKKANGFYQQKQYDSAAYYYEKIAAAKSQNAELYYNLGNAYYRLNDIGNAILNYKRALKIKPGYAYAQDNLLLAQSRMKPQPASSKDIFFIRWWHSLTRPAFSQVWAIAALVLFLGLTSVSFWARWRKTYGYKHRSIMFSGGVLFLFLLWTAFVSAGKRVTQNEAVLLSDTVFKADLKSTKTDLLPEGTIVTCHEEKGEWLSVKLADGREGWVQIASVEKI